MKEELEKIIRKAVSIDVKENTDCYVDGSCSVIIDMPQALTSIINLVDKEVIGSADEWDKKYPLSIKQDIKSRNNLRIEQRAKLKGVSNGNSNT